MKKPERKPRQPIDWWNKRRDEYVRGAETIIEIQARYSGLASIGAFRQRSNREHWPDRRREYGQKLDSARQGSSEMALALTHATQTDTRVAYALRARELADAIVKEAKRLVDSSKARSMDLTRLATGLRSCQTVEFAALGIAADNIVLTDGDEGKAATWEELMRREREGAGLAAFKFDR